MFGATQNYPKNNELMPYLFKGVQNTTSKKQKPGVRNF